MKMTMEVGMLKYIYHVRLKDPPDYVPWEVPENTLFIKAIRIHW